MMVQGGTEVVCSKCGSHLGDYFAAGVQSSYSYYCIDGTLPLRRTQPSQLPRKPPTTTASPQPSACLPPRLMSPVRGVAGVCLLPPGAAPGHVCEPGPELPSPTAAAAYKARRTEMRSHARAHIGKGHSGDK